MNAAERRVMEQALEALEQSNRFVWHYAMSKDTIRKAQACDAAIAALRAALAQQPEPAQAPAYKVKVAGRWHDAEPFAAAFDLPDGEHLLYAAPQPQRPPLTDEEMLGIIDDAFEGASLLDVVRAVERKVRGE